MPAVSVIIPSLRGAARVAAAAARQQGGPWRIEVVAGVRPNGRARNEGMRRAPAEVYIFLDDDVALERDDIFAALLDGLARAAVSGCVRGLPADATPFQRRVGKEVPLQALTPPAEWQVLTLPEQGRAWLPISTTCCAVKKEVFDKVGLFDETLWRGVDTEFFYRAARAGYSFAVAPNINVGHYPPADLRALLKRMYWTGWGHAEEARRHPARGIGCRLSNPLLAIGYLLLRALIMPVHALTAYSHYEPSYRPAWRPLKALASFAVACGYARRWLTNK